MDRLITIKISDLIGSQVCISAEDAQKVFDTIKPLLADGNSVIMSFENTTMMVSLFLNIAIGQLYGVFTEDKIRSQLSVVGLEGDDIELLKKVVDNAKRYYASSKEYDNAWLIEGVDDE